MANKFKEIAVNFKSYFVDELLLKTIYLKKMYPSPSKSLNQILFDKKVF